MANRYLPEDPSSWGPSEKDIEEFPYKDRGRKPPALADWEKFAAPWQKRAEERGFADPFAMIGRDIAAAEHDQRMRETEARMQAEIEREIGVPARAPRPGASGNGALRTGAQHPPASDNPSARPDDAMTGQAARPDAPAGARIGFTRPPPQQTLLAQPARRASTRLPEDGEPQLQAQAQPARDTHAQPDRRQPVGPQTQIRSDSDTISSAGAPDRLFGGEGSDAVADQAGDDATAGDYGRRDYGETASREVDALQRRILAGGYRTFAQAEAEIEARLGETPEVAQAFKKAARSQFDGEGNWQERLPGAGRGPDNNMARLQRRIARGQEIEEQAERDRQLFSNVNRSGAMKVERAQQPGWSLWDAGGGAKLALTNNVGRRFALDPKNGVPTLNLLQALIDPRTDPRAWREQALAFLPRRQPTADETWHGMADIDWARLPPDPDAVRQLDAQLALLGEGGDRMQAAYALLPLVGHRVLGASVLEMGIEFIVGLTPWGDVEEVSEAGNDFLEAAKAGSAIGMALATGRLMAVVAGYIPGTKLAVAGKRTMRALGDFSRFTIDPTKAREIVEVSKDGRDIAKSVDAGGSNLEAPVLPTHPAIGTDPAPPQSHQPKQQPDSPGKVAEDSHPPDHLSGRESKNSNPVEDISVEPPSESVENTAELAKAGPPSGPALDAKRKDPFPTNRALEHGSPGFFDMSGSEKRSYRSAFNNAKGMAAEHSYADGIVRFFTDLGQYATLQPKKMYLPDGTHVHPDLLILRRGALSRPSSSRNAFTIEIDGKVHRVDPQDIENITQIKTGSAKQRPREKELVAYLKENGVENVYQIGWVAFKDIKKGDIADEFMKSEIGKALGRETVVEVVDKIVTEFSKSGYGNLAVLGPMIGAALVAQLQENGDSREGRGT